MLFIDYLLNVIAACCFICSSCFGIFLHFVDDFFVIGIIE